MSQPYTESIPWEDPRNSTWECLVLAFLAKAGDGIFLAAAVRAFRIDSCTAAVLCVWVMSETLTIAAVAIQILSKAMSTLNGVRERAQRSKDTNLKEHINALYDDLLSLKEAVIRVTEENSELKRRIAQQEHAPEKPPEPELRQVGAVNYYFLGDKGPYCQPCYDGKGKLTVLTPLENWNDGVRRRCVLCDKYFYEKPMDLSPRQLGGRGGPQGWMG